MKILKLLLSALFILPFSCFSQDSAAVHQKKFNHEIGFNTINLLRQIVVFNTDNTDQLPFDVFYNLYYKNRHGLRFGLGILASRTETEISGQKNPRVTTLRNMNYRVGYSYNFARYQKVTLNAFADFLSKNQELQTTTTTTIQVLPNPRITQTIESTQSTVGAGGQIGVGVKYDIYRQLSLYIEVPLSLMAETSTVSDLVKETGVPDQLSTQTSRTTGTKIALPTSVYLVLRF
jgi:hypothetical protein